MLGMRHLGRRFCDSGWRFAHTGPVFTGAFSVTAATRYRYRRNTIPTRGHRNRQSPPAA